MLRKKREELRLPKLKDQPQEHEVLILKELEMGEIVSALSFGSKVLRICTNMQSEIQLIRPSTFLKENQGETDKPDLSKK